jgi:hypothetical protein
VPGAFRDQSRRAFLTFMGGYMNGHRSVNLVTYEQRIINRSICIQFGSYNMYGAKERLKLVLGCRLGNKSNPLNPPNIGHLKMIIITFCVI